MRNPQRSREGYLMVDHRASPGLPEDVARLSGFDPLQCREGKLFEVGTLTCSHCKVSVVKNPLRTRERPSCMKCGGHYICDLCAFRAAQPDYSHAPFDKLVDAAADHAEAVRQAFAGIGPPPAPLLPLKS